MTTSETPGDLKYLDASARRHIELGEALQRQRVMVVGDIHGLRRARACGEINVHANHANQLAKHERLALALPHTHYPPKTPTSALPASLHMRKYLAWQTSSWHP